MLTTVVRCVRHGLKAYSRASANAPFRTAALTSGTLMIAGDGLAQSLERRQETKKGNPDPGHNVPRSVIMASWGCTVLPLVWAPWYSVLDRAFTRIGPLSRMGRFSSALAKAVLTACTIASPVQHGVLCLLDLCRVC